MGSTTEIKKLGGLRFLIITGFGNIIDKVYDYKNIIQTLNDIHAFYKTKKYY
jgi:hypothetical protein